MLAAKVDFSNLPPLPVAERGVLLALSVRAHEGKYAVTLGELSGAANVRGIEKAVGALVVAGLVIAMKPLT